MARPGKIWPKKVFAEPINKKKRWVQVRQRRAQQVLLVLGTFFNPLGFDLLWALVQRATGSYWCTSLLFYLASISCFSVAWFLGRERPGRGL
jgi:hypothetical protein